VTQGARLSAWYFGYFAFIGAFLPYFSLYLQAIHLSVERIAVLMSLGQLMRLIAPLLWSALAARGTQRVRIVVLSAVVACMSFLVVFITQDFYELLAGLLVVFFFWSASLPLVEALTLGHLAAHPDRYGRIRLWGSVGFIAAVMGVGALLERAPIDSLLPVSWALLLVTMLVAVSLRETPVDAPHELEPIGKVIRQRKVLHLLAAGFCMTAAHGTLYVFYSIHLADHGYSTTVIGMLWTLGVVAEIVVFLRMPELMRRLGLRGILLVCFALAVLRFTAIGWGAAFLALLFVLQVLHGATFGAHHAASMAALNRWFSASQQAHGQALYGSVAYGAGGLLGALLAGQLWSRLGAGWSFTASGMIALIGFWLVWRGVPGDSAPVPVR
jgi:PPP family 3-phenylpropionic acid transporter